MKTTHNGGGYDELCTGRVSELKFRGWMRLGFMESDAMADDGIAR